MTFDDTIRRTVHIESEEDLGDTPFTYYLDADIGDTVFICEDADVYMREDKNGWAIYWHNNLMEKIDASDEDDKETYIKKYRKAQQEYKKVCNASLDGTLEEELDSGYEGLNESVVKTFKNILREAINHDSYTSAEWCKEVEDLIIQKLNLELLPELTAKTDLHSTGTDEMRFYVQNKGSESPKIWKFCSVGVKDTDGVDIPGEENGEVHIKMAGLGEYSKDYKSWYFPREYYPNPKMILKEMKLD